MGIQAQIFNNQGESMGNIDLPENIFGLSGLDDSIVHEVLCAYMANQRRGTAKTKTRAEVRGGGIKPWRQKGTGRARTGSIRNPLWKGGGIIFGPQPRSYNIPISKKKKRKAIKILLSSRATEGKVLVIEVIALPQPKTKDAWMFLNRLGLNGKKVLIISDNFSEEIRRAFRNLLHVKLVRSNNLNVYDILVSDNLIMTRDALETFKGKF